jgi:hypothetical protein
MRPTAALKGEVSHAPNDVPHADPGTTDRGQSGHGWGRGHVAAVFVLGWLLVVAAWSCYYVTSVLAGGPYGDTYANEPSFQYAMFAIFRLPIALLVLGAGLVVIMRWLPGAHAGGPPAQQRS